MRASRDLRGIFPYVILPISMGSVFLMVAVKTGSEHALTLGALLEEAHITQIARRFNRQRGCVRAQRSRQPSC